MKKIRRHIVLAIALAIVGLLITSAASIPMNLPMDMTKDTEKNIVKTGSSPECLSMQRTMAEPDTITRNQLPVLGGWPVFAFEGDQWHPGFAREGGGVQVAAFFDEDWDEILYTYSIDDGQTFNEEMVYWQGYGGDYPSIKHWDGMRFFGTYVSDYLENDGGDIHAFECTDALDYDTYVMWTARFSDDGWYDMIDADIACDNSQNTWEWGMHSLVISTTYGDGYTDGPTVYYSDPDSEGDVWISWYSVDGCAHCDIDIDPVPHGDYRWIYAVYDWYDPDADKWKLLVRVKDFVDVHEGEDTLYEIEGDGNLQYPVVAAYDNNIVILAETDQNGTKDIICYYTDDGNIENLQTSFVADTAEDERYPDVQHVQDDDFICTYVENNDLYALITEDGGANWGGTRWQINDNDGCVVDEYKTSDLCEKAVYAMWEEDCGDDVDIWMGTASLNNPPGAPTIEGTENGNAGNSYEYTFTAEDSDGDDVSYYIKWGDGDITDWTTFQASGTPYYESHAWSDQGTYTIEAKAKDTSGLEGPWGTLVVSMPVNQQSGQQQSSGSQQSSSQSQSTQQSMNPLFFQMLGRLQQNIR